jgi:hypothetical protein
VSASRWLSIRHADGDVGIPQGADATSAFPGGCRRDVGVPRRVPTRRRRSQEGADGDVGIPQDADETSALPGGFGVRRAGVHVIRLPYSDGHGSPTPFNCASRADRLAMVGEAD